MLDTDRTSLIVSASWRDYLELCKPRVVAEMVFTAFIGMLVAQPFLPGLATVVFGLSGICLVGFASAAINHMADRRIDALMARTAHRPMVQHKIGILEGSFFALVLGGVGTVLLVVFTSPLTTLLTLATLVGYSFIYTFYLKYATPQNIVIGGLAGAMPPLLGWSAVTGTVEPGALILVLIIFTWTPPHFWALAIERKDDYQNAKVPMLPVTHGIPHTRLQILIYTIALVAVSFAPVLYGMSGWLYALAAAGLGAGFLYNAIDLYRAKNEKAPMRTFRFSIWYLTLLFTALVLDHLL